MSDNLCAICRRPTPDGEVCQAEADRAGGKLADIIELTPDARLVAAGLVRRGGGSGSNKPGSRPPLNDSATDALDEVQNTLTTLVRDIANCRGMRPPRPEHLGHDPIVIAARWLRGQLEWMRHATVHQVEPYAVQAFDEIGACAGRLRGLVNGPGDRKFFGPCGSEVEWDDDDNEIPRDEPCKGDVFGHPDAQVARCGLCGARWKTKERSEWLGGEVRDHAFRAAHIAQAYGVNVDTIRSWAHRGKLKSYFRTAGGIVADWTEPPDGEERERLHYVGDVLDLAAADAARRAGEQAKRARRAAARAAETEDAA